MMISAVDGPVRLLLSWSYLVGAFTVRELIYSFITQHEHDDWIIFAFKIIVISLSIPSGAERVYLHELQTSGERAKVDLQLMCS